MAILPDIKPDYSANKKITPNVLKANLGDGYTQRAADGINNMPETWRLHWVNRSIVDIDLLENFFELRNGHESFDWIAPRSEVLKKYICPEWSRTVSKTNNDTLTATFVQVWDY